MMTELPGKVDIWDFHAQGAWIVIPTNGVVRRDGCLVMGRGLAMQTQKRFPNIPYFFGQEVSGKGNHVHHTDNEHHLFSFPVKHHWKDSARRHLVQRSCIELVIRAEDLGLPFVYVPRVGCGNGRLRWDDVKKILHQEFDDTETNFMIVHNGS